MTKIEQKIPEGWSVKKLGETCFFFNGKAHENCVDENGKYVLINSKFISSNGQVCKRVNACLFPLIENDITIVMSDVPNGKAIAKCFLVNEANKYTLNQRIGCLRTKQAIPQYLVNIISRNKYFLKFDDGINQTNLRKDQILNCPLLLPPLAEQEKIAGILGTWDEAIEKLSSLIEQKKNLKKGLMQRLLTSKTRLPGFTQPWKEVKLGEITNKISDKNHENCSNVVTISAQNGFVNQDDFFNKFVSSDTLTNYYLLQKGDFGYNRSYSKGYPLGAIKKLNNHKKAVVSTLYICFRALKDKINSVFLEQYFEIGLMNKELYKVAQEGARNHGLLNIALKDFFSAKLYIPSDITEQKAIADVLSTADDEINLLNQKLDALKEQKKGLMQQLLTGKIRVKVN